MSPRDFNSKYRFSIAETENSTGVSKERLRIWERRYGFPQAIRDKNGDRCYSSHQIEQLRLIKKLIDSKMKSSQVVGLSLPQLSKLVQERFSLPAERARVETELLAALQAREIPRLNELFEKRINELGFAGFLEKFAIPAMISLSCNWMTNSVASYQEHLFAEVLENFIRIHLGKMEGSTSAPKIILTTPPGEFHALGLLMVQVMAQIEGAQVLNVGTQMPIPHLIDCLYDHQADILGLSFSTNLSAGEANLYMRELLPKISNSTDVWVGGAGAGALVIPEKRATRLRSLGEVSQAVTAWRDKKSK